jgi:Family of unknown function (DUF5689)
MTNKKSIFFTSALMVVAAISVFTLSCNKKFDEPPGYIPPNVTATMTIAELKAMHSSGNVETLTNPDIIEGVVVANDSSGNFYKEIVIQDATGGMTILIDDYNLYTSFPVGRKVYVNLNGLFLSDYNGLVQLGGGIDGTGAVTRISALLVDTYIIKGEFNQPVVPIVISSISDLNDSYQSELIELDGFEFAWSDTAKTFADAVNQLSVNFTLSNCNGEKIVLRNSGFANFASLSVPDGNGTIYAIYTVFGSTKQLNIRDQNDVQFFGDRCSGSGGGGGGTPISLSALRAMYTGSGIKIGNYSIHGTVISDIANGNVSSGVAIIQDGNSGISIYFGGTVPYNIGDSIVVDVTDDSLISYKGSLEVKTTFGTTPPSPVATGKVVVPAVYTIQQLSDNLSNIEYTLVKVVNATASGGTTYSGSRTLTDASGNMTLYTSSKASFASSALPASAMTWTGYCNFFNSTKEIQIRNLSDVQ